MSELMAQKAIGFFERHQSRRGFLATCGKVALGTGMALAGVHLAPRRAFAGTCCPGTPCGTGGFPPCPPTPGCPTPMCFGGVPAICCDTGYVGATGTLHQCYTCTCGGPQCICEYDTGTPC
jgi:hypothetical protein